MATKFFRERYPTAGKYYSLAVVYTKKASYYGNQIHLGPFNTAREAKNAILEYAKIKRGSPVTEWYVFKCIQIHRASTPPRVSWERISHGEIKYRKTKR